MADDSKKPTSVNESAGGKVEFNSSKASFEYKSMQGGKVKLSGKVVDGVPKEYILVFEDDMFRLERATKNVASLRTESNRNSTWNQMVRHSFHASTLFPLGFLLEAMFRASVHRSLELLAITLRVFEKKRTVRMTMVSDISRHEREVLTAFVLLLLRRPRKHSLRGQRVLLQRQILRHFHRNLHPLLQNHLPVPTTCLCRFRTPLVI